MVFVGCGDDLEWAGRPPPLVTQEPTTETRIEKPYICIDKEERVYLMIPQLQRDSRGTDPQSSVEKVEIDNLKRVRVVSPEDPFESIQQATDLGTHLILSPGIYRWEDTLEICHSNQVVLGLGLATIQAPGNGRPCIHVSSHAQGVRLSGLCLEASIISKFAYERSTLLEWGEAKHCGVGDSNHPGVIHDLYCFVGGRNPNRTVQVQSMVKIYSSHVVGDNLWLWRADHTQLMNKKEPPNQPHLSEYHVTTFGECRCDTGLEVFGDHVTFYGLAIEHTYRDMLVWHGHHGKVLFYQSEMPYDVPGVAYRDVAGYRVMASARHHAAKGIGVYSYFRDYDDVIVDSAVAHHAPDGLFENIFGVWLNGYSGIRSILNGEGSDTTTPGRPFWIESYEGRGYLSLDYWKGIWKRRIG